MRKKALIVFALMVYGSAMACTNFIVGKKASADGSVMCTYSADDYGMYQTLCHYPAAKHEKGAGLRPAPGPPIRKKFLQCALLACIMSTIQAQ